VPPKMLSLRARHLKNHLYRILLACLTSNMYLQLENTFRRLDIELKNKKTPASLSLTPLHSLTHAHTLARTQALTHHSRKARNQAKQHMATILRHKNKLTGGMCLLGFLQLCSLCALPFLSSSIRLCFFFNQ